MHESPGLGLTRGPIQAVSLTRRFAQGKVPALAPCLGSGLGSRPPNDAFAPQVIFRRPLRIIADFRVPRVAGNVRVLGIISADDHRRLGPSSGQCEVAVISRDGLYEGNINQGAAKVSQGKSRIGDDLNVSSVWGRKSRRRIRKLRLETLEPRTLLSASLGIEPQSSDSLGQATAYGRLSANVLEQASWVAGLGWQVSKDAFAVPQEATTDLALRGAKPPALPAAPARSAAAAADGSVGLQAGSPTGHAPFGATVTDPSEFMIGDVWVTLVLLESNGAVDPQTENWSTTRIGQVKNEVLEGTQWWEDTLRAQFPNSLQELNISVDFTHADTPVPTAYEPINHGIADQSLWIDSFLSHVGYNTASSVFTDLDTWNHAQRLAHDADWALTAFVVDSLADSDGKFSDGYFAYAYLGGPFMMMTYDNNGWGISRMGQVFAHEFAHIFYALDEYPGSNTYTSTSGYYNIQNLNASDGHPNPASRVASLMAESSLQGPAYTYHTSSPTSLQMIGWRDSDNDGVFDVLDVPLTLTGSGSYNAASGQYSFSGSSNVNTLQNLNPYGYRRNITTNTVDTLQYRIDGNAWISGSTYGAYSTSVSQAVNVSGLAAGTHTIEFRTIVDTLNVSSNVVSGSFTVVGSNAPPVANPDAATTNEDTPVVIGVLANDSDADGNPLTIQAVTQGAHGSVTVNPNGTLTFAPSANYYGSDSFSYTVSDGRGGTAAALVSVIVVSVNDPPVVNPDAAITTQGTPVTIAVLANDSDVDGDPLSVVAVTQGTGGSVLVNADGTVTYTPAASFSGSDGFTYTASDGQGGTATADVTVQVQPAVKFFVVDNSADDTFRYNAAGHHDDRRRPEDLGLELQQGRVRVQCRRCAAGLLVFVPTETAHGHRHRRHEHLDCGQGHRSRLSLQQRGGRNGRGADGEFHVQADQRKYDARGHYHGWNQAVGGQQRQPRQSLRL